MLKGKAKEDFEKWYNLEIKKSEKVLISGTDSHYFNLLTFSMQYGVLVDWFDSVGIEINDSIGFFEILPFDSDMMQFECAIKTRQQARQKAIEKANEIFNNR